MTVFPAVFSTRVWQMLAALLPLLLWHPAVSARQQNVAAVPVTTATVMQQDVDQWLSALAQVQPLVSVAIKPQAEGILRQVLVQEGQQVARDQLLATLDDRAVRAALGKAQAELLLAQAQLAAAQQDLSRYQALARTQAVSAQLLDQQRASVAQLKASVARAEAEIAAWQVQLSFTELRAPVAGQVGVRQVDAGNYVRPSDNQPLFSLVQLDPIRVEFLLPQTALTQLGQVRASLRANEPVPVKLSAGPAQDVIASGQLRVLDNQVGSNATLRLRAEFANADGLLWPGQSVTAQLRIARWPAALTIPAQALRQGADGYFVWRVNAGKAEPVAVQLQLLQEPIALIQGLDVGQEVVVDGHSRLRPGLPVQVTAATAAKVAP